MEHTVNKSGKILENAIQLNSATNYRSATRSHQKLNIIQQHCGLGEKKTLSDGNRKQTNVLKCNVLLTNPPTQTSSLLTDFIGFVAGLFYRITFDLSFRVP